MTEPKRVAQALLARHRSAVLSRFGLGIAWAAVVLGVSCATLSACGGSAAVRREQEAVARESSAAELVRKGEASASVGDMTRAEQYYVAALRAGSPEQEIIGRLISVCVASERYPVALEYAAQYLRRHPHDPEVEFALASLHVAVGNPAQARELLQTVIRERPSWSEAHYALATVLREQGEALDLADQHDLEYLKLSPKGPLAEVVRARLTRATP